MRLILASASPRRRELMRLITPAYESEVSLAEEKTAVPEDLDLLDLPLFYATVKAEDIAKKHPEAVVIGCDTAVFIDGQMLGKPHTKEEAHAMLRGLSGRTHRVITGCCILAGEKAGLGTGVPGKEVFRVETEVTFYPLSEEEIADYVQSGEPMDKAGAYGIQEKGALLVEKIRGDYFNVVGFPVAEVYRRLKKLGALCKDPV